MESPKTYTNNSGFTLIEVILVVGIFLILCTVSLNIHASTLFTRSIQNDTDILLTALRTERTRAMTNQCLGVCTGPVAHGIYFSNDRYVSFQGNTYDPDDPNNETTTLAHGTHLEGIHSILFLPKSGLATTTPTYVWNIRLVREHGETHVITINSEGGISVEYHDIYI